jgi:hypothetical protein
MNYNKPVGPTEAEDILTSCATVSFSVIKYIEPLGII